MRRVKVLEPTRAMEPRETTDAAGASDSTEPTTNVPEEDPYSHIDQTSSSTHDSFYSVEINDQGQKQKGTPVKWLCLYFTIWQIVLLIVIIVALFFGVYGFYVKPDYMAKLQPDKPTVVSDCGQLPLSNVTTRLINCSKPELPDNSHFLEELSNNYSYTLGDEIMYECNEGYRLEGEERVLLCARNAKWRQVGQCRPIVCLPPLQSSGLNYSPTKHTFDVNENIAYLCGAGYILKGSSHAVCTSTGKWNFDYPTCHQAPTCSPPKMDSKFQYIPVKNKYQVNENITYFCQVGLVMNGSSNASCTSSGNWSSPHPTCSPVQVSNTTCPSPAQVTNGAQHTPVKCGYSVGDAINFTCFSGYTLRGKMRTICNTSGMWDAPVPTCEAIPVAPVCRPPQNDNLLLHPPNDVYHTNETVTFSCRGDQVIESNAEATCLSSGNWSATFPACEPITCLVPLLGVGMRIATAKCPYNVGDTVVFECEEGYELHGSAKVHCNESGFWNNTMPSCTLLAAVTCLPPNGATNGNYSPQNMFYDVGNQVTYSCDSGYAVEGFYMLTCMANGRWNYDTPQCTVIETPSCVNGNWTFFFLPFRSNREGVFVTLHEFCRSYPDMCPEQLPSSVEVVSFDEQEPVMPYRTRNQIVHFDPQIGLYCLHAEQIDGRPCERYAVRFCLPHPTGAPSCSQNWTTYFDQDDPFNTGDYEFMVDLTSKQSVCQNYPTAIDVRLSDTNEDYRNRNRTVLLAGAQFWCRNIDEPSSERCNNYKIRFCCEEVQCPTNNWTPFFNLDEPGGQGDLEMIIDVKREMPNEMCSGNVLAIDARHELNGDEGYSRNFRSVHLDVNIGFWCINAEQPFGMDCYDYKVRFCCDSTRITDSGDEAQG